MDFAACNFCIHAMNKTIGFFFWIAIALHKHKRNSVDVASYRAVSCKCEIKYGAEGSCAALSVAVYSEFYHYHITIAFIPDNNFLGAIFITSHSLYTHGSNISLSCNKGDASSAYTYSTPRYKLNEICVRG
jgi:hypothetical protein